jgi:site-specific DNA recombinase
LAQAGKLAGGGTRPFGFDDDRVTIRPAEAEAIRDATRRVLAGESLRSISLDWHTRGIVTPAGNRWRLSSIRRMLTSYRVAGVREHRGEPAAEAVWPPIVDREQHERLRAILLDPGRRTTGSAPRAYPLRGLAVCGLCGRLLVSGPKAGPDGTTRRGYRCGKPPQQAGCGRISSLADPLEEEVFQRVAGRLAGDGLARALATASAAADRADEHAAELIAARDRIDVLSADYYEHGRIGRGEFERRRAGLEDRMRQLETALAAPAGAGMLTELPTDPDGIVAALTCRDAAWSRSLLGVVLDRVEVGPAVRGRNWFDPDRVICWWLA